MSKYRNIPKGTSRVEMVTGFKLAPKKVNANNQYFRAAQQKLRCLILLSQEKMLK